MGYAYDAAGNLNQRTSNALIGTFNVNSLNDLTNETNASTLTVAGTTTSQAARVAIKGTGVALYDAWTFAQGGFTSCQQHQHVYGDCSG